MLGYKEVGEHLDGGMWEYWWIRIELDGSTDGDILHGNKVFRLVEVWFIAAIQVHVAIASNKPGQRRVPQLVYI